MNTDPEPSSSDLSETFSSDSRANNKKSKKKKKRRKHLKDDSSDPYLSDDSDFPMPVITDASDAKIRNIRKRVRSNNAQL